MPGKKVQEYTGPAPMRQDQVANFPPDPAQKDQLCRYAVDSLKDLVPDLAVFFPRQESTK